jgi:hypothetical protein
MRWRALAIVTPALVLAALSAGCPGGKASVSGDVTLDGQPLPDGGFITFVPVDQKTPNVEVPIQGGKYRGQVPAGSYKVCISLQKPTGEKRRMLPESPPLDVLEESLPKRYNENTDQRADIKPGNNKIDWPLKSK